MIDVTHLLEDSDTKAAALDQVADLEEAITQVNNRVDIFDVFRTYCIFEPDDSEL